MKGDWACPECVYVAEEALQLEPLHLSPAQALGAATEALHSVATDTVESEELDSNLEPASSTTGLTWLRWRLSKEPDFTGEQNMLQTRIRERRTTAMSIGLRTTGENRSRVCGT